MNKLNLEIDFSNLSVKVNPSESVFNTLTSALKDLGKSVVALQSQKKLQDAKATHASTFRTQWNAEKEFYRKKKKFMKN